MRNAKLRLENAISMITACTERSGACGVTDTIHTSI